ncbi:MAG: hypothetical protein KDA27_25940, partial [Candidatus Eisenbacteria bacterium]|nr:hypothetical protein [Candidatus Eisenbacteria bacterium]
MPGLDCAAGVCGTEWQGGLVVGGLIPELDDRPIGNIAWYVDGRWHPLGDGVDGQVRDVAVYGGDLFAVGTFGHAGGVAVDHVARWDGSSWSSLGPLPSGGGAPPPHSLEALLVADDVLYIGGDVDGGFVVWPWDGEFGNPLPTTSTTWRAELRDLAVMNGTLYAGGHFQRPGQTMWINGLARWNAGEHEWEGVDDRVCNEEFRDGWDCPGSVTDLLADEGGLWVAGWFTEIGGVSSRHLARWDGSSWSSVPPLPSELTEVSTIVQVGGSIFVSGSANTSSEVMVLQFEENAWTDRTGDLKGRILTLESWDDRLVAIGSPSAVGAVATVAMAVREGGEWRPFPARGVGEGLSGTVATLILGPSGPIATGGFARGGSDLLDGVAIWSEAGWTGADAGVSGWINDAITVGDALVIGGSFIIPGVPDARNVAIWGDSGWEAVGCGIEATVSALCEYEGTLIAGTNTFSEQEVWRFLDGAWEPMDAGISSGTVNSLVTIRGDLYAGGLLRSSGVSGVLRWEGARWVPLEGLNTGAAIEAMVEHEGHLVIAGRFNASASGMELQGIAEWSGDHWEPFGDGAYCFQGTKALASLGSTLVVGGHYTFSCTPSRQPMVWDGKQWLDLGEGTDGDIWALLLGRSELWVGGSFRGVEGIPSHGVARYQEHPAAVSVLEFAAKREIDGVHLTWECPTPSGVRFSLYRMVNDGPSQPLDIANLPQRVHSEWVDETAPPSVPLVYSLVARTSLLTEDVVGTVAVIPEPADDAADDANDSPTEGPGDLSGDDLIPSDPAPNPTWIDQRTAEGTPIAIESNPAHSHITIAFRAEAAGLVTFGLFDAT